MDETDPSGRKPLHRMTYIDRAMRREENELQAKRDEQAAREADAVLAEYDRPRTRGDCAAGPRPCPWVGCRHHMALDITEAGTLKLTFPDRMPWDLEDSCSLDLADRGGLTLEEIGVRLNVTRERVRQIEYHAEKHMKAYRRRLA